MIAGLGEKTQDQKILYSGLQFGSKSVLVEEMPIYTVAKGDVGGKCSYNFLPRWSSRFL